MKYSVIQCRKMSELFTSIIITEQISIHHFYFNILRATNTKLRHHLFSIFFYFKFVIIMSLATVKHSALKSHVRFAVGCYCGALARVAFQMSPIVS